MAVTQLPDAYHIVPQSAWDLAMLLALIGVGLAAAIGLIDIIDWLERL